MSALDGFWAAIEDQLKRLRTATSAAEVVEIIGAKPQQDDRAQAFFAGGGGDMTPITPLTENGWTEVWYEAHYHYALRSPDGQSFIEYVEGDVYASDKAPLTLEQARVRAILARNPDEKED